jgi:hypothetical protein
VQSVLRRGTAAVRPRRASRRAARDGRRAAAERVRGRWLAPRGGDGERIVSRASRAPLRGSLRSALTGCRLTPATRSADGLVRRWLRHLRPLVAGVFGSARCTCGPFGWGVLRLGCRASLLLHPRRDERGANDVRSRAPERRRVTRQRRRVWSGSAVLGTPASADRRCPISRPRPDGSSATRTEQRHGRALDAAARGLLAVTAVPRAPLCSAVTRRRLPPSAGGVTASARGTTRNARVA